MPHDYAMACILFVPYIAYYLVKLFFSHCLLILISSKVLILKMLIMPFPIRLLIFVMLKLDN